jgi:cysteine synthase
VTANFEQAAIDASEKIGDQEIVEMAHWLLKHEGLFVGKHLNMYIHTMVRIKHDGWIE